MKIGRNKPCPCGSGKKYKRCHGQSGPLPVGSADFAETIQSSREKMAAQRRIQEAQQGRGKPIISAKVQEHQIVAVGNQLHFSKTWKTFIDFLGYYIQTKITPEWGNAELAKPLQERHTILQWYDAVCQLQKESIKKPGEPANMEMVGVLACYYGLAYALYLIEHNVELQNRMISRLKDRSNFQGAYYELMVARALITAGFELTLEDESDRCSKHCEFAAVSKDTGQKFWIEAKMRSVAGLLGKNNTDGVSSETEKKPTSELTKHLNAAFKKPADDKRMIFIDLNVVMSVDANDESRPAFVDAVNQRLLKYEKESLKSGDTAYVFVTNMTFHRDLLGAAQMLSIPSGMGISDFNRPGHMTLSEIYRRDKKHADALRVCDSMSNLLSFPTTFDGSMPATALFGDLPPVQIGEKYNFEGAGANGEDVVGTVADAIVLEEEKEVTVAIHTDDDRTFLLKEKMTDTQLADYKAHSGAYFGKVKYVPKGIKTPYDMFLFFVDGQKDMERAKLLEHLHMKEEQAEGLSEEDLLLELCERQVSGSGMFKVVDGVLTSEPNPQTKNRECRP
jgi:hypothetical protein